MKFVKWSVTREAWNSVPGNRRAHPTSHALRVLWISSGKKTYVLNRDFPQKVSPTQRLQDIKQEGNKNNWRRKRVYLQTGQRRKINFSLKWRHYILSSCGVKTLETTSNWWHIFSSKLQFSYLFLLLRWFWEQFPANSPFSIFITQMSFEHNIIHNLLDLLIASLYVTSIFVFFCEDLINDYVVSTC